MLNARIFGPQQLYPAEPGWRAAFFREGDEPFEMAPVILEDGAPSHGAMDDLDFYALFAPGEEVTPIDQAAREGWLASRKRRREVKR